MSTVTAARMTVAGRAARASTEARNTKPSPPISRVESKKAQGASRRASLTRTRATDEKDAKTSIDDETVSETVRRRREASKASKETAQAPTLNPLDLGRRARQLTDGFFKGITGITQLARSPSIDEAKYDAVYSADLLSGDTLTEYETPNARFTTVLVVGAAGRVGRVLVRKLLLRGYTVKVRLFLYFRIGNQTDGVFLYSFYRR